MIPERLSVTKARNAFTLVEVMVAVAVTAMIIFMMGQVTKNATAVARTSDKHIDTDVQARSVLDRMAVDFAKMLKRTDVDYYIKALIGYKNPNVQGNSKQLKT